MREFMIICLLMLITPFVYAQILQPEISDNRPLKLDKINLSASTVPLYGLLEINMDLQATYSDAFNPDQINLFARITLPDKSTVTIPGFFYQNYTRKLDGSSEILERAGDSKWMIRYSPTIPGNYTAILIAVDSTGKSIKSSQIRFKCTSAKIPGFVRVSIRDHRYFTTDSGAGYFPVGANICWPGSRGTYDYDDWLPEYGKAGCNYMRIWLSPSWNAFGLEKIDKGSGNSGVGRIDQPSAWRLDYVLDLAQRNNIRAMLCMDSFNILRKAVDSGYPCWESSPLSIENGGPLKEPVEFWTNPSMLKSYRNKLRYMVARYGWRTNVLSWEFWNEVDIISSSAWNTPQVTVWHQQMAKYLRTIDPWKHPITTSFAGSDGIKEIDSLPEIDYTQIHNYGSADIAYSLNEYINKHRVYNKPCYVGEFGADAAGSDPAIDPGGIALHNGIWANVVNGAAGSAMSWWWDNHIHPHNLYGQYTSLTSFIRNVDFSKEAFKYIRNMDFENRDKTRQQTYKDLELSGPLSWGTSKANRPTKITINSVGKLFTDGEVAGIQHGLVNHRELHNPLTINTEISHPVRLSIGINGVSGYGGAILKVTVDGVEVIRKNMPDKGNGNNETVTDYDGAYVVDIPAGNHTTVVENVGNDWFIVRYLIENSIAVKSPYLRAYGLQGKNTSLIWIQNPYHTWYRLLKLKRASTVQDSSIMHLSGWQNGHYRVTVWDTWDGCSISTSEQTVDKGVLNVNLPEIEKDIAVRIDRIKK